MAIYMAYIWPYIWLIYGHTYIYIYIYIYTKRSGWGLKPPSSTRQIAPGVQGALHVAPGKRTAKNPGSCQRNQGPK